MKVEQLKVIIDNAMNQRAGDFDVLYHDPESDDFRTADAVSIDFATRKIEIYPKKEEK